MLRFAALLFTSFFLFSISSGGGQKHPDIRVVDFKVERTDDLISVHAKVRNIGERSLQRVNLIFRFLDTANATVTTQRTALDSLELAPGQESDVDAQMKDAPRAIRVIVLADRSGGVDMRVADNGPYIVE